MINQVMYKLFRKIKVLKCLELDVLFLCITFCHFTKCNFTLSGRTGSALVWHSEVARSRLTQGSMSCDLQPALQCAIRGAQGVLPCVGWGVPRATRQLDMQSLTPLSVAGCG